MPTTSNFGWNTPADTDLVKDGALAIRTLGDNIDASLVDLKGGTTGQILSKASNSDLDYTWITNDVGDITEVVANSPLTGGGSSGSVSVGIQDGTTAQKGAVQLEDSTSSTSTTKAATPNSVKTAYDLADAAIPESIVNAKGDLISASADNTPAILTAGSNGETLLADSSQTTGLRWGNNLGFTAGKNKIINGDCLINQRNFSSGTATGQYIVDRFQDDGSGGTRTASVEQFTAGAAPVAGYEAKQYVRLVSASQASAGNYYALAQNIEDVRVLAGQTATVSFWAKAASGTPNIGVTLQQNFGSGGSATVTTSAAAVQTITTSWARYSFQVSVPSISGKTIGTSSLLRLYIFVSAGTTISGLGYPAVGLQNNTFDLWGVQVEAGSVATAFQTATGTLAGELALCQRYYWRNTTGSTNGVVASGIATATGFAQVVTQNPVQMRIEPTSVDYADLRITDFVGINSAVTALTIVSADSGALQVSLTATVGSGLTQFRPAFLTASSATGYLGLSAEL